MSASSAGLLASRPSPLSMTVGIRPSQRAARASDGCRGRPATFAPMTQTGGLGRCTGGSGTSSSTGLAEKCAAVVGERLAAHQPVVDGEALVELLGSDPAALVVLERGPVAVQRAEAHAHHRPAAAEPVDGQHRGRQVPRTPPRGRGEQRAQPDPLGHHRGGAERHPRVQSPDRFPGEHAVPAPLLAERRQRRRTRGRRRTEPRIRIAWPDRNAPRRHSRASLALASAACTRERNPGQLGKATLSCARHIQRRGN